MIKSFAVSTLVRNVIACGFLTATLAACGSSGGSAAGTVANTAASDTTSLVSPDTGYIDRTGTAGSTTASRTDTAASVTTQNSQSTTSSQASTSASNQSTGTTGASTNKTSTSNNGGVTSSAPSTGATTLDWTAPTENSDGSVLSNLAGYTVYYGTSRSNLTQTLKITNPGLTAYTMTNLPAGAWYFAITAMSADGSESTRSGVVGTTI